MDDNNIITSSAGNLIYPTIAAVAIQDSKNTGEKNKKGESVEEKKDTINATTTTKTTPTTTTTILTAAGEEEN